MENKISNLIAQLEAKQIEDNARLNFVETLLSLEPEDRLHRLDRIHFLLQKIKFGHERGSMSRKMIETIIDDINILCSLSELSKLKEITAAENSTKKTKKTEKLIEYCYSSKAKKPFTDKDLMALRSQAKAFNAQHNITGFLAYDENSQSFFQILEGTEKAVHSLLNKISQDPRHSNIVLGCQVKIKERTYGDWSMSLVTLSEIKKAIAHVDELDSWLANELFIKQELPSSKSRNWVSDRIKSAYNSSATL